MVRSRPPRWTAVLLVFAAVAAGCSGASATDCERMPNVRPGLCIIEPEDREPVPTEPGPVLGADGEEISLADTAGTVTVVNFWASWCGPCRREQPDLNTVSALFGDEVAFLGVNVTDSVANAQAFRREFDVPYDSISDRSGSYAARFGGIGPRTMPSTVIVDAEGRVAVQITGETNEAEVTVLTSRVLEDG